MQRPWQKRRAPGKRWFPVNISSSSAAAATTATNTDNKEKQNSNKWQSWIGIARPAAHEAISIELQLKHAHS